MVRLHVPFCQGLQVFRYRRGISAICPHRGGQDTFRVGVNLDIGNFPDDAYRQIEMCAPYATNVHFKSEVHMAKKAEPTDVGRVLGILARAGYRGYLALEYEAAGDPRTEVPKLIAQMRQAMGL